MQKQHTQHDLILIKGTIYKLQTDSDYFRTGTNKPHNEMCNFVSKINKN